MKKHTSVLINHKAQDIQDKIFIKMSAEKKIKMASKLTIFCLKLNRLNGKYRPRKTSS